MQNCTHMNFIGSRERSFGGCSSHGGGSRAVYTDCKAHGPAQGVVSALAINLITSDLLAIYLPTSLLCIGLHASCLPLPDQYHSFLFLLLRDMKSTTGRDAPAVCAALSAHSDGRCV